MSNRDTQVIEQPEAAALRALTLASLGNGARVLTDRCESEAVRSAAENLVTDLTALFPSAPARAEQVPDGLLEHDSSHGARILIGTAGISPWVEAALGAGDLTLDPIRDEQGALRWESFVIQVSPDATTLQIVGADRRGTVYGIYRVAELLGVSPWAFWADAIVQPREELIWAEPDLADWPSVRYRGVFLNDEELLEQWSIQHTGDSTIGPETYARIGELILRLGGNYLWPAMHVNAFNHDERNGSVLHDLGIVVGTSHCDMLLRSNQHEWTPWVRERGYTDASYDYSISGENRDRIHSYWAGSVEQNAGYEVSWTLGMRGIHDSGFITRAIDEDPSLDEAARHRARVDLLGQVIADQRAILGEHLARPASEVLTTFVPYKEVLPLYDDGLDLPPDVTIIWADDNFGYVRRLPNETERQRPGGHGLYYHSSYWAHPGMSNLYLGNSSLPLMAQQLERAFDGGIQTLWINNVGALKPLELETEVFLRAGWKAGRDDAINTASLPQELTRIFLRDVPTLGERGARAATEALLELGQIAAARRVEHLTDDAFAVALTSGDDEAARRVARLEALADRVTDLLLGLPAPERDTFHQLLGRRVLATWLLQGHYASADRSRHALGLGHHRSADAHLANSARYREAWRTLNDFDEHGLGEGRWQGIVQPERFPPPTTARNPAGAPALQVGAPRLAIAVVGSADAAIELDSWGSPTRLLDVVNTGSGELLVGIEAHGGAFVTGVPDGDLSVAVEARLAVGLAEDSEEGSVRFIDRSSGEEVTVPVRRLAEPSLVRAPAAAFVEADGVVSIPAAAGPGSGSAWRREANLGRDLGDALVAFEGEGEAVRYDLVLRTAGVHVLELHRLPTLDSTGRLRVGVAIDSGSPVTVESFARDEWQGGWREIVMAGVDRLELPLPPLEAGHHTIDLIGIDAGFAITHLVLRTRERAVGMLPPVPSSQVGNAAREKAVAQPWQPLAASLGPIDRLLADYFPAGTVPLLPPEIVAGPAFWESDVVFEPLPTRPAQPGFANQAPAADGSKNLTATWPTQVPDAVDGVLALEAEHALLGSAAAWLTAPDGGTWEHVNADSEGGSGLALRVVPAGMVWADSGSAPALHHRIRVTSPGTYRWWALVWVDGNDSGMLELAVDGALVAAEDWIGPARTLWTYGLEHAWHWRALADIDLDAGEHELSVIVARSGARIDRLYLSMGSDAPPSDKDWRPSGASAGGVS